LSSLDGLLLGAIAKTSEMLVASDVMARNVMVNDVMEEVRE